MKTIALFLFVAISVFSCNEKEMKFYKTQDLGYEVSFIGISDKKTTPDDVFEFIKSGSFVDSVDVDFLSQSDYGEAYLWHVGFVSLECLHEKAELKDSFNVNIRLHDLSESIPTISDVNKILVRWFGFWGDSYGADGIFIDENHVRIRSLFDCRNLKQSPQQVE